MIPPKKLFSSSVGKKIINGLTAVGLVGFVVFHLLGNLSIYGGPEAFNTYAHKLHELGWILYAAEVGLVVLFVFHIGSGLVAAYNNAQARSDRYEGGQKTKGAPSNMAMDSKYMAVSGILLLIFVVVHVLHFRVGAWMDVSNYQTTIGGKSARDLYGMVAHAFNKPGWVVFYTAMMIALGFHLRHGIWSMFQTLGLMNDQWTPGVRTAAAFIAVLLAVGFLMLPLYLFLM